MKEFKYEIKKHIGTVSSSPDGKYATEVNLISYNNAPAKVDIRNWNKETGQMYKGITLTAEEAENLTQILLGMKDNG
ncbi:MAG: PC4/YdbC family ssDNA-binding protein [Fusicatenibacter sp.]|nr:PC4/YdbC family ssDNA-binding protein [Fusicatenibacter sp.]